MNPIRLLVASLALAGCSAAWAMPHLPWHDEGCGAVLAPVPELLEPTENAIARWWDATQCAPSIGEDGIPVTLEEDLEFVDENGDLVGACGLTLVPEFLKIEEDLSRCYTAEDVLVHEIGHVLAPRAPHSTTGIFAWKVGNGRTLNADSLTQVCSYVECLVFNPETEE